MHVPFIDLSRSVETIKDQVLEDWKSCLDNCDFVGGPSVTALEKALEEKLDVKHFYGCSNGTDAIMVGLQAMGIGAGMRVALPNMTFWAPYEAIIQLGAIPVLIDIDEKDLQMDFEEFTQAHKRFHFDAAILVHLFGWCSAHLEEYRRFCQSENIVLLEDGAQAFGVTKAGESVFKNAQLTTTSFYPAKVFGGSGDGGGISTPNPKTGETIRALANHGRAGHYTYDYVGWNARMGGLQAKYLLRMVEQIDQLIASRRQAESFYQNFFSEHPDLVTCYQGPEGVKTNGYLAVFTSPLASGDEIAAALKTKGIGCARTYPQTLCEQPPAQRCLKSSELHRSKRFSQRVVNLPLFAGITEQETEASAIALLQVLREFA